MLLELPQIAKPRPLLLVASALLLLAACGYTEEVLPTPGPGSPSLNATTIPTAAAPTSPAPATVAAPTHPTAAVCDGLIERIKKAGFSGIIDGVPYAFLTTAGASVQWDESPQPSHSGYAPPGTSKYRAYAADTPAVFCYLNTRRPVTSTRGEPGLPTPVVNGGIVVERELWIMVQGAHPIPVQSGTREQVQPDPPAGAISLIP